MSELDSSNSLRPHKVQYFDEQINWRAYSTRINPVNIYDCRHWEIRREKNMQYLSNCADHIRDDKVTVTEYFQKLADTWNVQISSYVPISLAAVNEGGIRIFSSSRYTAPSIYTLVYDGCDEGTRREHEYITSSVSYDVSMLHT